MFLSIDVSVSQAEKKIDVLLFRYFHWRNSNFLFFLGFFFGDTILWKPKSALGISTFSLNECLLQRAPTCQHLKAISRDILRGNRGHVVEMEGDVSHSSLYLCMDKVASRLSFSPQHQCEFYQSKRFQHYPTNTSNTTPRPVDLVQTLKARRLRLGRHISCCMVQFWRRFMFGVSLSWGLASWSSDLSFWLH